MAAGKDLNHNFLEIINDERERLLKRGENESQLSGNVIDVSGNNTEFIVEGDEEKFEAINELKNYLEFSSFQIDETYEIPGVRIFGTVPAFSNNTINTPLYIKKDDITKIADKAEKFEQLLGIKFPAQIHQCKSKYIGEKVPGTNIDLPRPKLMSETLEQYEEYLRELYQTENVEAEPMPDGVGRQPYPHEQVDFSIENEIDDFYTSESYTEYLNETHAQDIPARSNNSDSSNNRIDDDNEYTVRESEDLERTPLGQKIGSLLTSFENTFKNASTWQKIRHAAIGAIATGGLMYLVYTNPVGALTIGACAAVGIPVGLLAKKGLKAIKKKVKNWLYGPVREEDQTHDAPTQHEPTPQPQPRTQPSPQQRTQQRRRPVSPTNPQQGGQQPQPGPVPTSQPTNRSTVIPLELDPFFEEAGININQLREIEGRISVVESELNTLNPSSPEYSNKASVLARLKEQQKEQLEIIEGLLEELLQSANITKTGGRGL